MSTMDREFYKHGYEHAEEYSEEQVMQMLQDRDPDVVHEAMGVISKRKLSATLQSLQDLALYSDDLGLQQEAILTIRRIGGRKGLDILRFLKTTEHKEMVEFVIKKGADKW